MNQMPNRKNRRMILKYQGMLKRKGKLNLNQWLELVRNTQKAGREIYLENLDKSETSINENYESIEVSKIEYWKELGFSEESIEKLREASAILKAQYKSTWHADKKYARNLIKEAYANL